MSIIGYLGMLVAVWIGYIGIGIFRKAETDPDFDSQNFAWYGRIVVQLAGVGVFAVAVVLMWTCLQLIAR